MLAMVGALPAALRRQPTRKRSSPQYAPTQP